ncbi:MAG: nucleotidyltransferase substrate binding protein [Bdellovibrionales bacterium]|nr:nucleotidyltransferase substrate binding protein [Bdellovibrionales bacterium]
MNLTPPELSLAPLKNAISSLKRSLEQPKDEYTRDSSIQRFEYTFELSWKTLKRYFSWNQSLDESNIRNLFREAGKQSLIQSVEQWFGFHRSRNKTSHIYSEKVAEEVYETAKEFLPEVEFLQSQLEKVLKS